MEVGICQRKKILIMNFSCRFFLTLWCGIVSQFNCEQLGAHLDNLRDIVYLGIYGSKKNDNHSKDKSYRGQTTPTKIAPLLDSFTGIVAFSHSSQQVVRFSAHSGSKSPSLKWKHFGNTLAIQWLELHVFTSESLGSILGWGPKMPPAVWDSQKKKKKVINSLQRWDLFVMRGKSDLDNHRMKTYKWYYYLCRSLCLIGQVQLKPEKGKLKALDILHIKVTL